MSTSMIPTGWSYEGPDESVGIFGDAFVHETCKLEEPEMASVEDTSDGLIVTCECGASFELEDERDYEPEPEYDWDE